MPEHAFEDHFSAQAGAYARYRPHYPEALFAFLASCCPEHALAWDCGTGNGQAAVALARHFTRVVATDASAEQLARAAPHTRITYAVAPAEHAPLAAAGTDLVSVAQALHWFPFEAFFAEVRRVLEPAGVLAAWGYGLLRTSPDVDRVIDHYYHDVVGPYWPPERQHVEAAYATIPFPFEALPAPSFEMEARWDLASLLGYLGTWSAARQYRQAHGTDSVAVVRADLTAAWGPPEEPHPIRWPLFLRLGR